MTRITTTIDVCDRCGSRHNTEEYGKGSAWGHLNLSWRGDKGGRAYDGAAGGVNLEGKVWLCLPCTDSFLEFIKGKHD